MLYLCINYLDTAFNIKEFRLTPMNLGFSFREYQFVPLSPINHKL